MKTLLRPFVETVIRLTSKSPRYFQALQILLLLAILLIGFVQLTKDIIQYPVLVLRITSEDGLLSAGIGLFFSLLPTKNAEATKNKVDYILKK